MGPNKTGNTVRKREKESKGGRGCHIYICQACGSLVEHNMQQTLRHDHVFVLRSKHCTSLKKRVYFAPPNSSSRSPSCAHAEAHGRADTDVQARVHTDTQTHTDRQSSPAGAWNSESRALSHK